MSKIKSAQENYKISTPRGSYSVYNEKENSYHKRGFYYHPKGIVDVYADSRKGKHFINMTFVYNGVMYSKRIWNCRTISDKALSYRAGQFVKSLSI